MPSLFESSFGLGNLALISDTVTRSISPENPDGSVGGGAHALPPDESHPAAWLGEGWKVRPRIFLQPASTLTLADIEGPGVIQHIWITVAPEQVRNCVLRMFWDDEETPSVEVPLGDFFANVFGYYYHVNSLPVAVNPTGGYNCYWAMPFRRRARITLENQHTEEIPRARIFYQITYALGEVPEQAAYFHAQYRRSMTTREYPEHTILDGVRGQGHYVGTVMGWNQFSNGWWGEGEIKFYLDGDGKYPTICGTGTEDYFGGAFAFQDTFSTAFLGYPLWRKEPGEVPLHGLYRWHIPDPIRFQQDLRVTMQALGWWPNGKFQPLTDDISSVAYWYQTEPHAPFPTLPTLVERWRR